MRWPICSHRGYFQALGLSLLLELLVMECGGGKGGREVALSSVVVVV